jgi:hypothetical protein
MQNQRQSDGTEQNIDKAIEVYQAGTDLGNTDCQEAADRLNK